MQCSSDGDETIGTGSSRVDIGGRLGKSQFYSGKAHHGRSRLPTLPVVGPRMTSQPRPETSDHPPRPFSVAVSSAVGGILVATVAGDVDIATAASLSEAVLTSLDGAPGRAVILDLTEVSFMDSTGLRAVLDISRRLDEGPAGLVLLSPNRPVRKLLSLAGLDERMPIATTLAQAEAILAEATSEG